MDILHRILLYMHIISGFISLVLFWIPVFTRKGGINHRKVGLWYVRLMWIVVGTAAILSIKNLMVGKTIMGAFLGFISIITANPLYHGIAILKNKKSISPGYRNVELIFNLAISLTSVSMIIYGIYLGGKGSAILMFIFGGLGLTSIPEVYKGIRKPKTKSNWYRDHIVNMMTSGIAAYTAFLVFGANRFLENILEGMWSVIPWVAPTIIGTIGIRWSVNKYQKKSSPQGRSSLN